MTVAFRRATEAKAEIRKTPRDKHVDALVKLLFGTDNAKITDAATRLERVQRLDVFTTTRPGPFDVIIYCSADHFIDWIENGVKVGLINKDRNTKGRGTLMDSCRDENHNGDTSTRAVTTNIGKAKDDDGNDTVETQADSIQLCPWYLKQLAGPPPMYNTPDELIKKAADTKAKSLL